MDGSNPYSCRSFLDGEVFTTEAGTDYFILFHPDGPELFAGFPELEEHIFSVLFFPLDASPDVVQDYDERILLTVADAIRRRLRDDLNVIIFLVDDSDGRHKARAKLFNLAFAHWQETDVEMVSDSVKKKGDEVAGAIILRRNHPMRNRLVTRFRELLVELSKLD